MHKLRMKRGAVMLRHVSEAVVAMSAGASIHRILL